MTEKSSPAPRDKAATQRRILDAAIAEFAARGLSGARVDRIADAAGANKRMIYVYFGNKEELFDHVVAEALQRLIDAVPLVPEDLPSYAGAMFDALMDDPSAFRLSMWRQLERPTATTAESRSYAEKQDALRQLADGPEATAVAGLSPSTCLALVLAIAQTWHLTSPALQDQLPPRAVLREAVVESVRRITAP
ncbi:TetR family transcriptional regulator [Nocardioides dongkuii]|uniref:TetR family transcriptional regulator n=1 Tax=Nocardioides dongkuii TaxID=2760089 RepID=UPI0015FCB1CC|nr:TetR family transcriptional regulator [Nocardioides dongkuii]